MQENWKKLLYNNSIIQKRRRKAQMKYRTMVQEIKEKEYEEKVVA